MPTFLRTRSVHLPVILDGCPVPLFHPLSAQWLSLPSRQSIAGGPQPELSCLCSHRPVLIECFSLSSCPVPKSPRPARLPSVPETWYETLIFKEGLKLQNENLDLLRLCPPPPPPNTLCSPQIQSTCHYTVNNSVKNMARAPVGCKQIICTHLAGGGGTNRKDSKILSIIITNMLQLVTDTTSKDITKSKQWDGSAAKNCLLSTFCLHIFNHTKKKGRTL